jgi:hypothetical protein
MINTCYRNALLTRSEIVLSDHGHTREAHAPSSSRSNFT